MAKGLKKIGEDMKKKQKSIKINLIMNTIKTLMSLIFPLITFPYASRILGATGIGRVNYASSIVSYFSMFAALGISTYAVREGARIRDDKEKFSKFSREMLNINLCTTFIAYCALAVFLALPILGNYKKLLVISSLSNNRNRVDFYNQRRICLYHEKGNLISDHFIDIIVCIG